MIRAGWCLLKNSEGTWGETVEPIAVVWVPKAYVGPM